MTWTEDPMSARTDYTGCRLAGSVDGEILYSPPNEPYYYHTGVADPSPETSAAIRRIEAELNAGRK